MSLIRPAEAADVPAVRAVVDAAYRLYLPRMEQPPGPMLDDYDALVAAGHVSVLEADGGADEVDGEAEGRAGGEADGQVAGVIVLLPQDGYLLLDNVAVAPGFQGRGLGRLLIAFAEDEARRLGFNEVRLYTHVVMTENQSLYAHIGFEETHRGRQDGYDRVFMRKRLA